MNNQEKTFENLTQEKYKIIDKWFNEINNFDKYDDVIWRQKNRALAGKLYDILYLLQQKTNDYNIKFQYDLVSSIDKYIDEKNRFKVLSMIKNLKSLEMSLVDNDKFISGQNELNEDDIVNQIVDKIILLPAGTEFTISSLMDENYKHGLEIATAVIEKLRKMQIPIKLKYNGLFGLPQNMIYIKLNR